MRIEAAGGKLYPGKEAFSGEVAVRVEIRIIMFFFVGQQLELANRFLVQPFCPIFLVVVGARQIRLYLVIPIRLFFG